MFSMACSNVMVAWDIAAVYFYRVLATVVGFTVGVLYKEPKLLRSSFLCCITGSYG